LRKTESKRAGYWENRLVRKLSGQCWRQHLFDCEFRESFWPVVLRGIRLSWGARFAHCISRTTPLWIRRATLWAFANYARMRHDQSSDSLAYINEFVARRTALDYQAMQHRLRLVIANDPCEIARYAACPVFQISGLIDPIVPWFFVRRWLRKNCQSLRDSRIVFGDHNVLGTASNKAAEIICGWISK
jgi:hypothetical protein